ncbi:hypothetical protein SKAU_G00109940 [Synaphobranchus kaupii]|uniref:Uncharacterized protein n=1 Tax=Synaphobranchus kaupii TaxID=118154 RepID=A0A9Q1J883_SYNKA|nr:hypothetical protein SKAU_G00109940 [Synaphobranchus kaupii]
MEAIHSGACSACLLEIASIVFRHVTRRPSLLRKRDLSLGCVAVSWKRLVRVRQNTPSAAIAECLRERCPVRLNGTELPSACPNTCGMPGALRYISRCLGKPATFPLKGTF